MRHVKKELLKRKKKNPRYESSWYGPINTTSTPVYRPESPNRLAVRPQETLRPPLKPQNTDEGQVGAPIHRLVSADHLGDDSSDTLDDDLDSGGDYAVQATGQGPERDKSVPNFVIDQQSQAGKRRLLSIAEIKRTTPISQDDIDRFNNYGDHEYDEWGHDADSRRICL